MYTRTIQLDSFSCKCIPTAWWYFLSKCKINKSFQAQNNSNTTASLFRRRIVFIYLSKYFNNDFHLNLHWNAPMKCFPVFGITNNRISPMRWPLVWMLTAICLLRVTHASVKCDVRIMQVQSEKNQWIRMVKFVDTDIFFEKWTTYTVVESLTASPGMILSLCWFDYYY